MQSDRRFVKNVQTPGKVRPDLSGQPNALSFATRQRCRASTQCQITDTDVVEEMQPIADLSQNPRRDQRFTIGQLLFVEYPHGFGDGQVHVLRNRPSFHAHRTALSLQPFSTAGWTRTQRPVRLEVLLLEPGAFLVSPAEVRNQSFEPGAEWILDLAVLRLLFAGSFRLASPCRAWGAIEDDVAQLFRQPAEGH